MKTVKTSRALALGVTAALAASAFSYSPASAAPSLTLDARSQDGKAFQVADYADGDITVQVTDGTDAVDVDDSQDLRYSWTVTPFAPNATPVTLPAMGADVQATDVKGAFVVPLPISQGPGTYKLTAVLDEPAGTMGAPTATLDLAVGTSTATIDGLGASTPGLVQEGTLTVTAPDNTFGTDLDSQPDPVAGQAYSLTVDHGFFTGGEATPSRIGDEAGNLTNLGTRLTGVTDANGVLKFDVGIARDAGFDDDGRVAATVKLSGSLAASDVVDWSTDDTLNGRVAIRTSPTSEQTNPVNPTLAGNQTYYDVFALDQFGNPVDDQTIYLDYTGRLKDYIADDTEFQSNFDTIGDIFVVSNVADRITVTGTWESAPSYRYINNQGGAARVTDPAARPDAVGSTATTTYEIDFNASRYSMSSSVSDTVRVGTTVTQTVRAVDQQGNPIEGFQVRFLRFGPDATNGDVVATKSTNALGEATYSFIGTRRGRALITAEVTDGNRRKELNGSAAFGAAVNARLARTKGKSSGGRVDRLTVSATKLAKGARVNLYKVVKGKQKLVGSKKLGKTGTAAFAIRDRNKKAKTKYVAVVRSTSTSIADQSRAVNVR
ncbi:Ig-like domain-containing protein [Aeromicrobium endophyticum]|uniref:Big-1 domain-containing protein n=1 Tax=Aeromicrobium endophyticum TaxID=2292704 RepID=A0A371P8E9_9ACTN|nr:Ig-like domain-containing protein [Aeromicrobium endophyticum]REK72201.1 hypothetical protein DX116_00705 [Aeromicrobium endophyticum]